VGPASPVIEVKRAVADHPQDDMLDCPGRSYGSSPDRSWKLLDLAVAGCADLAAAQQKALAA